MCGVGPAKGKWKKTSLNRKHNNNKKKIKISELLSDKENAHYSELTK